MKKTAVLIFVFFAINANANFNSNGNASPNSKEQQQPKRPLPPKEALQACEAKTAGDACTFTGRRGETLEGTCFTPETSKPLACKPLNHDQRNQND